MFKGLRTKIESEQKGKIPVKSTSPLPTSKTNLEIKLPEAKLRADKSSSTNSKESISIPTSLDAHIDKPINSVLLENYVSSSSSTNLDSDNSVANLHNEELIKKLKDRDSEILQLRNQLSYVTKERDENNDQNAQLYQLIEKLRRNSENEKETISSLTSRLNEAESILKEKNNILESLNAGPKSVSLKLFTAKEAITDEPQTLDDLRLKINELQNQISEKSRQIRIKNQNINDMKKALQKEINDHNKSQDELSRTRNDLSKTQDELNKLQAQLKQQMNYRSESTLNDCSNPQNGSEEIGSNNGPDLAQLDGISILSRSSASVNEFDSNDLPQNCDKDVNHEYLRNVIFRYMTSTDNVTAKHLVKAISVMMNFTPEQSAAVKDAIGARKSWLRLN